jgi:predicted RNA-binding Zn-ribbon protein involved in translation (DUF1610 family)
MISAPVLQATGQTWKVHAATALNFSGLALMVWGVLSNPYLVLAGVSMALLGAVFCSFAIRCPQCGAHWYWRSFKAHKFGFKPGWARELFRQVECPSCSYKGPASGA